MDRLPASYTLLFCAVLSQSLWNLDKGLATVFKGNSRVSLDSWRTPFTVLSFYIIIFTFVDLTVIDVV